MVKPPLVLGTVAALALAASGCGVFCPVFYPSYGRGFGPDIVRYPDYADGFEPSAGGGPACGRGVGGWRSPGRYGACEACGQPCDSAECGPYTDGHCGPLTLIFDLFRSHGFWGSGCGGRYYGEWWSDPPDCCDPCDFNTGGVPYDGSVVPSQPAPCTDCQQAASVRRQGRTEVVRTPPRGRTMPSGPTANPPTGYASRQAYAPRPAYPSSQGYGTRQVPQAARPQTAPTSYAY